MKKGKGFGVWSKQLSNFMHFHNIDISFVSIRFLRTQIDLDQKVIIFTCSVHYRKLMLIVGIQNSKYWLKLKKNRATTFDFSLFIVISPNIFISHQIFMKRSLDFAQIRIKKT